MNTIYMITNLKDGKAYVGFDSKWPSRKAVHICEAITRKNRKYPLYNAIRKYGLDNFRWDILYQNKDREHTLNIMETKFIINQNTHFKEGHGYNMTYGGEGAKGWIPSEETKKKISESNLGKKAWNKGKPSPWTSLRNKNSKGKPAPNRRKEYVVISPSGETFEVKGISKFAKENGLYPGNLVSVAKGRLKQYKGWKCFYK